MDRVLRGWVIGHLLGEAIRRRRDAQQRWCAIAYSEITSMAWAYNHRSARAAEHAALAHGQGPRTWLCACGAEITIAVACGPGGAFACHWADPRIPTHAATGALATCRASYPPHDPDRHHVWLALVLDAHHGVTYRH
jgi:hypothetical protein